MNQFSFTSIIYFVIGWIHGYTATAILLLSVLALAIRRRRRALIASISTLSWIVLASGIAFGFVYALEILMIWKGGDAFEWISFTKRLSGFTAWLFWIEFSGSVLAPQLFWFRRPRRNAWCSLAISASTVASLNLERFIIYITSYNEFLPSSWR